MKKTILLLSVILGTSLFSCQKKGCTDPTAINYNESAKKDDGKCVYEEESTNVIKSGFITTDETWTSNNIYELQGKVVVSAGATLTIEPGTIIKGGEGSGTLASALVVAKGGKINAVGTPSSPIIFTSVLDNIQIGEILGTNLDESDNGMWGGVIILGNAPISAGDGDVITQIEGIPVSDSYGAFGGNNPNDNSGTMSYVSIRHGGALIGSGNEINGLTLGGVGNGTSISNIEVVCNLDDGVEFFGGTVNVNNLIIGMQGDDGIDIDMNYAGSVDNFFVVNGSASDEALEIDGPEGITHNSGLFTLTNGTVYTYGGGTTSSDFKSKAQGTLNNVKLDLIKIRASYSNNCTTEKEDAYSHLTDAIPTLIFQNCESNQVNVYTSSQDDLLNTCTVSSVEQNEANSNIQSSSVQGGSISPFGWTWLNLKGKL